MSQWIIDSSMDLDEGLVQNAWNGRGYAYFNEQHGVGNVVMNVEDGVVNMEDSDNDDFGDILIFSAWILTTFYYM